MLQKILVKLQAHHYFFFSYSSCKIDMKLLLFIYFFIHVKNVSQTPTLGYMSVSTPSSHRLPWCSQSLNLCYPLQTQLFLLLYHSSNPHPLCSLLPFLTLHILLFTKQLIFYSNHITYLQFNKNLPKVQFQCQGLAIGVAVRCSGNTRRGGGEKLIFHAQV